MEKLPLVQFPPSILHFQKGVINEADLRGESDSVETLVSVALPQLRGAKALLRCCKFGSQDVAGMVQADLRVLQISTRQDAFTEGLPKVGVVVAAEELAHHLLSLSSLNRKEPDSDVDEEEAESSVGFNDALWCTSKDIQMLKSGTIKMMRLTVISNAPLSTFLYETNHKMTGGGEARKSETAETTLSWKSLEDKLRSAFLSYELHVGSQTLVDLRACPLSSKGRWGSPSASFVFVELCDFLDPGSDVGKVSTRTEILINHVHHISHYKRQVYKTGKGNGDDEEYAGLAGVGAAEKVLTSLIEMHSKKEVGGDCLDNFSSTGLLIAGPSGCGKKLVVRETVKKLRAAFLLFNPVGKMELGSLREKWTSIFHEAVLSATLHPTVLLVPRVDQWLMLLIKKGAGGAGNRVSSSSARLVNHVCNLLDGIPSTAKLTVVATTDKPYLIPTKLRRSGRFEREVYIGAPSEEERLRILKSLVRKVPSLSKLDLDSVARRTPGYVGQDLIRLAHLAVLKSHEEKCSQVEESHIKYALSRILPSVLQGSLGVVGIHRATSLDHIAGLDSVKQDLIKAIVWPLKYPHAFRTMGITPPKGILLHSPPGCAKTTLVRAVAASHQTNFLAVSAAELFSSGVGDSEKIVADLFHRARMASPCILFIDELETIVGSRQISQKKEKTTNESILSMLLTEMDGVGTLSPAAGDRAAEMMSDTKSLGPLVLTVAATNRIDMIDSALLRPGRFDKLIYVPPLNKSGRAELLRMLAQTTPFSPDVNFDEVAAETEGFTGADIVNLCKEAALISLTDDMDSKSVTKRHMTNARSFLSPSLESPAST